MYCNPKSLFSSTSDTRNVHLEHTATRSATSSMRSQRNVYRSIAEEKAMTERFAVPHITLSPRKLCHQQSRSRQRPRRDNWESLGELLDNNVTHDQQLADIRILPMQMRPKYSLLYGLNSPAMYKIDFNSIVKRQL